MSGNVNQRQQRFQPTNLAQSRFQRPPQTANPMGLGREWLMGGVMQPLTKINSLPGYGTTAMTPEMMQEILKRRTAGLPPPGSVVRF